MNVFLFSKVTEVTALDNV